jgi:hypothetical protein
MEAEYHEGQSVKVLKCEDTLDSPWTEGTIGRVHNGFVAAGCQVVIFADGSVGIFEEKYIRKGQAK